MIKTSEKLLSFCHYKRFRMKELLNLNKQKKIRIALHIASLIFYFSVSYLIENLWLNEASLIEIVLFEIIFKIYHYLILIGSYILLNAVILWGLTIFDIQLLIPFFKSNLLISLILALLLFLIELMKVF